MDTGRGQGGGAESDETRRRKLNLLKTSLASWDQLSGTGCDHYRPRRLAGLGLALLRGGGGGEGRRREAEGSDEATRTVPAARDEEGIRALQEEN